MEQKSKKVINVIGMILLVITIVVFNLVIGANEKGLRIVPISILMTLIVIYLIVLKIINRGQSIFFKSKVDYFVLVFMLTTTLPLIFGTCASYSDTVEFMMKYFFIYSVYILARNVIKDKKQIECVIITTLVCSLFSVILWFDYNNTQFLKSFVKWIDLTYDLNAAFCGTFGYANAQAIYMAFCLFLAIHRFKVNKSKILKVVDILYIVLALYIIYIAEARVITYLLVITFFILFIVKFRKKLIKHKIKTLFSIVIIIVSGIVFLVNGLKISKTVIIKGEDTKQRIRCDLKQNQKYTLELELETINNGELESFKDSSFIIKVYQSGKYFIDIKLASETIGEVNGKYKIDFTPIKDTDSIYVKIINKYKGIIKVGKCYIDGKEIIINYRYIPNNLAYILSGYSIPEKSLTQRLYMYQDCLKMAKDSPIIGHGGNAWKNMSRAYAEYKGALKESHSYFFELLISYGIIGVIAFLTLIVVFFIKIFKQCKKYEEKRKYKLLILIGLLILLLYNITFDFGMSFMLIQLVVYIFIATLLYDEQECIKKSKILDKVQKKISNSCIKNMLSKATQYKILDIVVLISLVLILSLYIRADVSKYFLKDVIEKYNVTPYNQTYYINKIKKDISSRVNYKIILNELKDYMNKELFKEQRETYEKYFKVIYNNLNNLSNNELEDYLSFGIERFKKVKVRSPMYFDTVIKRTEVIANIIKNLNKYKDSLKTLNENVDNDIKERIEILNCKIEELQEIINNEYDINIRNLEDFERTGYEEKEKENLKKKYMDIINSIRGK